MYDELIKALHEGAEFLECSTPGIKNSFAKMCRNAADAIEELSRELDVANDANIALYGALPKWIPVTEELPDVGERVLCYCRANIYEVMMMRTGGDWVYDANHVYMHSFVTHWMKCPEPPREVNNG